MGLAFAFGWTPCIGPVLATILAIAGSEATVGRGAGLLAAYSLGLGIPFLIAGLFAGPFMAFMGRFRRHLGTVEKVMGGLLVVTGILFITGNISDASYWLLETFPGLGTIG
jgi:cytochrome c-type biogenesis protein